MRSRRSSQQLGEVTTARDAAVYDAQVVPRYSALFGRMLLRQLPSQERLQVLDVGCGTGYPSMELLSHLGQGSRVIAIDPDPSLLDLARRKAVRVAGRRIFFKVGTAEELGFGEGVFDLVVGNLALGSLSRPELALSEMRRVLVEGGHLLLTNALAGTFEEVLDMFREVALKDDDVELGKRLERIAGRYPEPATLEAVVAASGFTDVEVSTEEFHLPFGSAAEIFSDPVIRFAAIPEWRWIAGFAQGSEAVLERVQRTLDTYFGGGPLSLRVHGGLVTARA